MVAEPTTTRIAGHVWDGRINGELVRFDEYCAVVEQIADGVETAL